MSESRATSPPLVLVEANKEAASVAVWSAYWTTLLGISLCFWIRLRGIDRFLSRQMWFFAAPGCTPPPLPALAAWRRAAHGDWIAHVRPPAWKWPQFIPICENGADTCSLSRGDSRTGFLPPLHLICNLFDLDTDISTKMRFETI